jgi:DNA polymerase III alpha subunit
MRSELVFGAMIQVPNRLLLVRLASKATRILHGPNSRIQETMNDVFERFRHANPIPFLNRKELTLLARIGALNQLDGITHRRDALWQVERAGKLEGPLLRQRSEWLRDASEALPLRRMNTEERLVADYAGTGLTIGKHPMYYRRSELRSRNVLSAEELRTAKDGDLVHTAGCVIARQRPGTAKGFIFLSMEDEGRDKIKERSPKHSLEWGEHPGGDDRCDRVGRIMEAVKKVEDKSDSDEQDDKVKNGHKGRSSVL